MATQTKTAVKKTSPKTAAPKKTAAKKAPVKKAPAKKVSDTGSDAKRLTLAKKVAGMRAKNAKWTAIGETLGMSQSALRRLATFGKKAGLDI